LEERTGFHVTIIDPSTVRLDFINQSGGNKHMTSGDFNLQMTLSFDTSQQDEIQLADVKVRTLNL